MDTFFLRFKFAPLPKNFFGAQIDGEWGGIVEKWPIDGPPCLAFGKRERRAPKQGRVVSMLATPGQLLYYGGYTKTGKPFKHFAIAWRCMDRTLIARRLPADVDARAVFAAGGHQEPADDIAQTLESIVTVDLETDPLRGFQELCSITASYMEAHLLVGAPVFSPDAQPDGLAVETVETLVNHSLAWPLYREVLLAAAEKIGEWHRGQ